MEEKKKTAEQMAQEKTADNLMNCIIAKTFSRHSKLSEEEFLKEIGFENSGKTEDEAVRIAFLNVLVEATKVLLQTKESCCQAKALLEMCLKDENAQLTEQNESEKVQKGE